MLTGKLVFSQLMDHLPMHILRQCIDRYGGNHKVKSFTCLDQYLCMSFAQLTYRSSLRDIEICLRAHRSKLYHMGIRGGIARNTLANANKVRDWRIYADFASSLIATARQLYAEESFGVELNNTVYALDSTTIDLCLAMLPWAQYKQARGAIKLHTLLDLRGNIPSFIHISDGKLHDASVVELLLPEPAAFYIMDRGYTDYGRLYSFTQGGAFFVLRARANTRFRRIYSCPVDRKSGLICDQTIVLSGVYTPQTYPEKLRRIKYHDDVHDKTLVFLTNNFRLPALTIAELYKCRWQVELFFKWIKQHLRIRSFFGTSENAVKTQVWIAVSVYVLVAIIKKRLGLSASLYTILQVLSLTIFERLPLNHTLTDIEHTGETLDLSKQLNLFE